MSRTPEATVASVFGLLLRNPWTLIVGRWNWKTAIVSAAIRGTIFLVSNLTAGLGVAVTAALVEILFVATTNGAYGALTQAFSKARPHWAGALSVMIVVPAIAHSVELLFHWAAATPQLRRSILASIAFSAVSALFNVFAMRRDVLVTGEASRPLTDDLRRLPAVWVAFMREGVRIVARLLGKGYA